MQFLDKVRPAPFGPAPPIGATTISREGTTSHSPYKTNNAKKLSKEGTGHIAEVVPSQRRQAMPQQGENKANEKHESHEPICVW